MVAKEVVNEQVRGKKGEGRVHEILRLRPAPSNFFCGFVLHFEVEFLASFCCTPV